MNNNVLSPEKTAELKRLNAELLIAQQHVAAAFQTRLRHLTGQALTQLMDEERKLTAITLRIRKLKGE
jgi:hypothetical protein